MSGVFYGFYTKAEEALLGHVNGIDDMLFHVESDPERYDPRSAEILRRLRILTVVTQIAIHEANEVLRDIESAAIHGYAKETLTRTIDGYLKKYPLTQDGGAP